MVGMHKAEGAQMEQETLSLNPTRTLSSLASLELRVLGSQWQDQPSQIYTGCPPPHLCGIWSTSVKAWLLLNVLYIKYTPSSPGRKAQPLCCRLRGHLIV